MISSDMQPLNRAAEPVDSAGLILAAIWAIYSVIYLADLFGGGSRSRRAYNGPMQGANVKINMRISFMEAVFGVEKNIEIGYKEECETCHGTGANQEHSRRLVRSVMDRQVVYTQQSLFGQVRNVQTCP